MGKKCVAGCKVFYGGEIRHHKDCAFYPNSFSEMYDKLKAENAMLQNIAMSVSDYLLGLKDEEFASLCGGTEGLLETVRKVDADYSEYVSESDDCRNSPV